MGRTYWEIKAEQEAAKKQDINAEQEAAKKQDIKRKKHWTKNIDVMTWLILFSIILYFTQLLLTIINAATFNSSIDDVEGIKLNEIEFTYLGVAFAAAPIFLLVISFIFNDVDSIEDFLTLFLLILIPFFIAGIVFSSLGIAEGINREILGIDSNWILDVREEYFNIGVTLPIDIKDWTEFDISLIPDQKLEHWNYVLSVLATGLPIV